MPADVHGVTVLQQHFGKHRRCLGGAAAAAPPSHATVSTVDEDTDYPGCTTEAVGPMVKESCAYACAWKANCTGAVYAFGDCYLKYGVLGGKGCDSEEADGVITYRMLPPGSCPGGTHQNGSACVAGECRAG
jgi:hypothetical protein